MGPRRRYVVPNLVVKDVRFALLAKKPAATPPGSSRDVPNLIQNAGWQLGHVYGDMLTYVRWKFSKQAESEQIFGYLQFAFAAIWPRLKASSNSDYLT